MAALAAEEDEAEEEEEEDWPNTGLTGLLGMKPKEELSELEEELLEADEDEELLPEELEVPANTAPGNGRLALDRKLFRFGF